MNRALHLRYDINRLYISRKEGGRWFASIEDCMDASKWGIKDYIKKSKEKWITVASNTIDNIRINRTIQKLRNRNKKKCMDISSDKLLRLHTRQCKHGYERETLREKLNLFS